MVSKRLRVFPETLLSERPRLLPEMVSERLRLFPVMVLKRLRLFPEMLLSERLRLLPEMVSERLRLLPEILLSPSFPRDSCRLFRPVLRSSVPPSLLSLLLSLI